MSITMASAETTELRFSVGTRVECKLGAEWKSGTVCIHFFTQDNFPKGMCVPYQIALDEGLLIFARRDDDCEIRALLNEPEPPFSMVPQLQNRPAVLRALLRTTLYVAFAFCLMQAGEYHSTGAMPLRMTFLEADLLDHDGWLSFDGVGVASACASLAIAGLQVRSYSESEWLTRPGIYSRTGKRPDLSAVVLLSVLKAIGQETFFRGAVPMLAVKSFADYPRDNAVAAGLIVSIVGFFLVHPADYSFFAILAGFCFSTAGYYGGVQAAILASLLAQLGATLFFFARGGSSTADDHKKTSEQAEPSKFWASELWAPVPAPDPAVNAAEPETVAPAPEEPEVWEPMPRLDPFLPYPENRRMVLRSLRASFVYTGATYLAYLAGSSWSSTEDGRCEHFTFSVDGSWLRAIGIGMALALAVVGGLDFFSAANVSGYLHDSALAWLNGGRVVAKDGRPDRLAILFSAATIAVGHEIFFRGALPFLACAFADGTLLPATPLASVYGLAISVVAYPSLYPAEYACFACFAAAWFAVAAYSGGIGSAIIASTLSQVGASTIYFYAVIRSKHSDDNETKKSKSGLKQGSKSNGKTSTKKQR